MKQGTIWVIVSNNGPYNINGNLLVFRSEEHAIQKASELMQEHPNKVFSIRKGELSYQTYQKD